MKGLVCVKELTLYLVDDRDSLKSFKQEISMVDKEGYKQIEEVWSWGLRLESKRSARRK